MGVYIYQSKHIPAIKIGHYKKSNAWSRIAHRGFYSCSCPEEIKEKVSIEDLELLYWFPALTVQDEKKLHRELKSFKICGEWFKSECVNRIVDFIKDENKADECSKSDAINTRRRL